MTLEELERVVAGLAARVSILERSSLNSATADFADDRDLDGQYGNPEIRKDPPLWIKDGGMPFVGMRYSQTAPEYLDALASFLDWQAKKDTEKGTEDGIKYAGYKRKDAARARGWAKRLRSGWVAALAAVKADDDSDLPF